MKAQRTAGVHSGWGPGQGARAALGTGRGLDHFSDDLDVQRAWIWGTVP